MSIVSLNMGLPLARPSIYLFTISPDERTLGAISYDLVTERRRYAQTGIIGQALAQPALGFADVPLDTMAAGFVVRPHIAPLGLIFRWA